ncbi:GNAT family N-acetyltransferase [Lentzea cavernae]|uniref:GNAT family acetyltransferase n=1 Tax=Lentzea cavernae TaxID=2020703 RepID=A0ABQ3MH01_9PSEU|nr:GNAT family N-acetyltransferase [Lentzea cavernae]GHH41743.1 GNAT family acetyltransferase [Lentzea cavernae]
MRTEHLTLRPVEPSDVDSLRHLHADPEVMRFLDPAPVEDYLGDGFHAAHENATGRFVGWFEFGGTGEVELGYRLHRAFWGLGYATEGAKALIERGFTSGGVRRVVATTMAVNAGSRRVMEKCGLRYVRTFHVEFPDPLPGAEHGEVEYALTHEEWRLAAGV